MDAMKSTISKAVHSTKSASNSGKGKTVLITGGSGFVAAEVLKAFLGRGYHVRTTVRSDSSADKIKQSHAKYLDQLEFAIVKDIQTPGAFDEAVKGVDGVVHTASPFVMDVEDNKRDLLDPALKGTTEILASVASYNPNVKRVVLTSSFASIWNGDKGMWPEHTYTEKDWNPVTFETASNNETNGAIAYCASKTFAERAAFDFVAGKKPNFSISTICPPMIYGPSANLVTDLKHLNTSAADIYRLMNGTTKEIPETTFFAYCDVRDVGEAHARAYESEEAAGQRYFVTGGNFTYQMVCDIIRRDFPELKGRTPEGNTGEALPSVYKVDSSKARKELGMDFRSLDVCIHDQVKEFLALEKKLGGPETEL